jgi:hypothetical protein
MKLSAGVLIVISAVVAPRTGPVADVHRQLATNRSACPPIGNVDSVLVRGRVTLFGEMHGTDQMPAFVGNVLCHAAARHLPATLGVELSSESSVTLDDFVRAKRDSAAARTELLADTVWHELPPDGRTSLAMVQLLETARSLARAGADIRVVAFSRPSTKTRDSTMAVELATAIARDTSRVVVVLTGNIHSRMVTGIAFDSTLRPMGLLLRQMLRPRRVVGLDVSYQPGTAWLCFTGTPCGPRSLKGNAVIPSGRIELGPLESAYDGAYGVGAIVASPPAVRSSSEPSPAVRPPY